MRDLARFLKMYRYLTADGLDQDKAIATSLDICYGDWKLGVEFNLVNDVAQMPATALVRAFQNYIQFESLHTTKLSSSTPMIQNCLDTFTFSDYQDMKGPHAKQLQALVDCLHSNLPVLVITNDPQRFSKTLQVIAKLSQTKLKRILLNDRSDTT
jgi:hypothetical protein